MGARDIICSSRLPGEESYWLGIMSPQVGARPASSGAADRQRRGVLKSFAVIKSTVIRWLSLSLSHGLRKDTCWVELIHAFPEAGIRPSPQSFHPEQKGCFPKWEC